MYCSLVKARAFACTIIRGKGRRQQLALLQDLLELQIVRIIEARFTLAEVERC